MIIISDRPGKAEKIETRLASLPILENVLTLRRPLRRKVRMRWFFDIFFAELPISQRWSAVFCATGAWGLKYTLSEVHILKLYSKNCVHIDKKSQPGYVTNWCAQGPLRLTLKHFGSNWDKGHCFLLQQDTFRFFLKIFRPLSLFRHALQIFDFGVFTRKIKSGRI